MSERCPTCGQTMPKKLLNAAELLDVLTRGDPHREVYRGDRTNRWFVTYGGGETTFEAVQDLVRRGEIHSVYSCCADSAYHVGRTVDWDRSVFSPKKARRVVYLD